MDLQQAKFGQVIVDHALTDLISEDVISAEVLVGVANNGDVFFAVFTSTSLIGAVPSTSCSISSFSFFAEIVYLCSLSSTNPSSDNSRSVSCIS